MIPMMNIVDWSRAVPWVDLRQVEQGPIISRAIVDLFSDPFRYRELRFRGGTALNKLHFPAPMRFSEDIDLVRTTSGPVGAILARIRDVLEPQLSTFATTRESAFRQSILIPRPDSWLTLARENGSLLGCDRQREAALEPNSTPFPTGSAIHRPSGLI
jgi:hypothetical protein